MSESRRQGGPAICDRGQVRVGTRFAHKQYEVSYIICQQFVVEFERVSVHTNALLGEASRDVQLSAGSKIIPEWWNI